MKKAGLVLLSVTMTLAFTAQVWAAEDYNDGVKDELNQEIDQMITSKKKTKVEEVTVQAAPKVQPAAAPTVQGQNNSQPVYIIQQPQGQVQNQQIQNQQIQNQQVQNQPVTTIETTALKESRAEQMRRQREEMERQTEDRIQQRLEEDRANAEKERSERMFANPTPVAPAPTPVAVVAPVEATPVIVAKQQDTQLVQEEERPVFRIGGQGGIGSYPSASNVTGAYAAGLGVDVKFGDGLGVEGAVMFSSFDINNIVPCNGTICVTLPTLVTKLNQINVTGGVNYRILTSRISPVVGALISYTRRSYSAQVNYGSANTGTTGSNAFDGGFMGGVDVAITKRFSVGADIRYLINMSYRPDNALNYLGGSYGSPVESFSYYFATVNLKIAL